MVSPQALAAFAALAIVVIVIPGPSVLFVVGRALQLGRGPALVTVFGSAAGVFVHVVLVAFGVGAIVAASGVAFTVLKVAGGAYLAWLGVQAVRHRHEGMPGEMAEVAGSRKRRGTSTLVREAFTVGVLNPKSIVFLAAALPALTDSSRGAAWVQMMTLGVVFVAIAILSDGTYALLASGVRHWFGRSTGRLATMRATGGVLMVLLGVALALTPHTA